MIVTFIAFEKRLEDASRNYRCNNQAKQLENFGCETFIFNQFNIDFDTIEKSNIIIFQRCIFDDAILKTYNIAKKNGSLIISEFDDLIFLPSVLEQSGGVRSKVVTNLKRRYKITIGILKLIPLSDYIIVSTEELKEQVKKLGAKAILSRNAIDDKKIKMVGNYEKSPLKKILYMSGTRTHNSDFLIMQKPLLKFLKMYPDVSLTLLGEIDVSPEFKTLKNVYFQSKLPYEALFEYISGFDVSLVPLEDTIFNHAKSSLKFYESGYVGVPVIASPLKEFLNDIEDGENGLIANNEKEWFEKLEMLYEDEEFLYQLKIKCNEYVRNHYTISSRKDFLKKILYEKLNKLKKGKE